MDLAVVKVVVPAADLEAVPISPESPAIGEAFLIGEPLGTRSRAGIARVRSRSARLVVALCDEVRHLER